MTKNSLKLDRFSPYRLSVLSNHVSTAIARHYERRFKLSIPEWRVTAVLGEEPGLSAREVAERSAMDKVQVSRAVASLITAGRVKRTPDPSDGRVGHLELTRAGRSVYEKICPLALDLEQQFLKVLTVAERKEFDRLLTKLSARGKTLA